MLNSNASFGNRLRTRREQLKLPQQAVADRLAVEAGVIGDLESDNTAVDELTVRQLRRLADALESPIGELLPPPENDLELGVKIQGPNDSEEILGERGGGLYYTYHCLVRTRTVPSMVPLVVDVHVAGRDGAHLNDGHPGSELIYVMSGDVHMQWGDSTERRSKDVPEGSSIYIAPFVPHAFTSSAGTARLIAVNF